MSININNIYCSQWLVNKELKDFCNENKNENFYLNPHDILHIEDTINYKALQNNNFEIYNKYISNTNQKEHGENIFKTLLNNFDVQKMEPILIEYSMDIDKYIVRDGLHRLAILVYKDIYKKKIPLKHLNILYKNDVIQEIKQKLIFTTNMVFNNGWHNNTTFGYHSFNLYNININGQRNPSKRLQKIKSKVDFTDKFVLDFGCNSGGMLLHLPEIKKGIGYDFNPNCIKVANYINNILKFNNNLSFREKDLNEFNFNEIKDEKVDIIFLLALGSWIKNWEELYRNAVYKSDIIIYETNNDEEAKPQLRLFKELKCDLSIISFASTDDITNNHKRKTYLIKCTNNLK